MAIKELMAEYEALKAEKNRADETAKESSAKMKQLEEHILEELTSLGLKNATSESGTIFYTQNEMWVSPADPEKKAELHQLLANDSNFADLVTSSVSAMSLRTRWKEIQANGESIDPRILALVKVSTTTVVRTRKQ